MQEIELKIGTTTVKLSCEDPKKILDLAAALNNRVEKLKKENNLTDIKALFINSIYLMDEIESINQELQKLKVNFYDKFENERENLIKTYAVIIDKIEEVAEQLAG